MVNLDDTSTETVKARFITEAEKLGCTVYPSEDETEALAKLIGLIEDADKVLAWDDTKLPFPIKSALSEKHIKIAEYNDALTLVGITGVDIALAATGSLVVSSGEGKFRTASLLPDKHIALVKVSQLTPDFETWIQAQREVGLGAFKESSNTVIISGPSKTADIGQELVKGAHGPRQVHIILIE
jgi:L-lactate dehydrogenase complex protein LldG